MGLPIQMGLGKLGDYETGTDERAGEGPRKRETISQHENGKGRVSFTENRMLVYGMPHI